MKRCPALLVSLVLLWPVTTFADQALEQERLTQIVRELELVRALVDKAREQTSVDPKQRIRFKYTVLADQLLRLENAVRRHIDYQNSQPKEYWSLDTPVPQGNGSP